MAKLFVIILNCKKATQLCPCRYLGDALGRCHCTSEQVASYRARISGPLLDRIDMYLEVPRVSHDVLRKGSPEGEETIAGIRMRVISARNISNARTGKVNALMTVPEIKQFCPLSFIRSGIPTSVTSHEPIWSLPESLSPHPETGPNHR